LGHLEHLLINGHVSPRAMAVDGERNIREDFTTQARPVPISSPQSVRKNA
jgi:hypothetical protein